MATLVLSAAGTAIGGPIGATIGSIVGSQIDAMLFGPPDREGPRLQDLRVTTSSYGTPIPRHFGKMRAAGSVIWAAELVESSEESGGKGQPSVTTYSYAGSFAVALSSRPIKGIGRIWADGNLLRGAAGDLKVGGELRIYFGSGDQEADPLIASAEGQTCPAYRGLAYCVFEQLQLAEFGNRIPSLTFEVLADDGTVELRDFLSPIAPEIEIERPLDDLEGLSDEGGMLADTVASIDRLYPIINNAGQHILRLQSGETEASDPIELPDAVVDAQADGSEADSSRSESIRADETLIPVGMRYYDIERDFQAGVQRAGGKSLPGRNRLIEFPGAFQASNARRLADDAASRARRTQNRVSYRIAEIVADIAPGKMVSIPGRAGVWRVESWEWRESGVELELVRIPQRRANSGLTDPGRLLPKSDLLATPTLLEAYELPWDGRGSSDERQIYAAASSISAGWRGASLYALHGPTLDRIGHTGLRRSILGNLMSPIGPVDTRLLDRTTTIEVELRAPDHVLAGCTFEDIANGQNRALVGNEIIQFANAEYLGDARWRLSTLLRGRGGTENSAHSGHPAGESFTMLNGDPVRIDSALLGASEGLAAIGLADTTAVADDIANPGVTLQPLTPVHPGASHNANGDLALCWKRRARGKWQWSGTVEVALVEQAELYEVGLGAPDAPIAIWQTGSPELAIPDQSLAGYRSQHSGAAIWVRQVGTFARSLPLLLTTLD